MGIIRREEGGGRESGACEDRRGRGWRDEKEGRVKGRGKDENKPINIRNTREARNVLSEYAKRR